MRLVHIAILSIVTLLVSHILLVDANKQKEGRKEKERNGQMRGSARGEKKTDAASSQGKGNRSKGGHGSTQGKFVSKEKADCIWSVTGGETVTLRIDCKKGESSFSCIFGGNPSSCSKYAGNEKSYWKQISRALRKQKNICQDSKAVLKSKECKKGPQEAHMSYISPVLMTPVDAGSDRREVKSTVPAHVTKSSAECTEDSDPAERQNIANEYCGESWGSFCNFFFSMVQSKNC